MFVNFVPQIRTTKLGYRAFLSLLQLSEIHFQVPPHLHSPSISRQQFLAGLKTHLFKETYTDNPRTIVYELNRTELRSRPIGAKRHPFKLITCCCCCCCCCCEIRSDKSCNSGSLSTGDDGRSLSLEQRSDRDDVSALGTYGNWSMSQYSSQLSGTARKRPDVPGLLRERSSTA